jgi:hypothetical protein
MLAPLFGFSESRPASPGDMGAGDFDNTPAPSARPSISVLRSSEGVDNLSTDAPTFGRTASYRHHLLKTSTSGPLIVDTDISAPPILSRQFPSQALDDGPEGPRDQHENKPTSVKEDKTPPKSSTPASSLKNRGVSPDIPASERVCLDPALHVNETHAHAHHPGLLKGADFCDVGAPTKETFMTNLSSSKSDSSDGISMSGSMGHSRMVKVRPAFNYHPMNDIVNQSAGHEAPYRQMQSKVKPFNPVPQLEDAVRGKTTSLDGDRNLILAEFSRKGVDFPLNVPTAKVRPFSEVAENTTKARTPMFFDAQEKVRPFKEEIPEPQGLSQTRAPMTTQDDEVLAEQWLDRPSSRRHTICADDVYPVGKELDEHEVEACDLNAAEADKEAHALSQCEEYPDKNGIEVHGMDVDVKAPVGNKAENHGISRCEKCAAEIGAREHSMGSCTAYPDQVRFVLSDQAPSVNSGVREAFAKRSRSTSLESGYVSNNAMQWIRDILKYSETYSSKLTNLPRKSRASQPSASGERRTSEPARLPGNASLKSSELEPRVDGTGFKKAVGDLQRLLDEAMAIACQVVDQPIENTCCDTAAPEPAEVRELEHQQFPAFQKRHTVADGMVPVIRSQIATPPPVHSPIFTIPHRSSSKRNNCPFPDVSHGYCTYCHTHRPCSDDIEVVDFERGFVEHGHKPLDSLVAIQTPVTDFHLTGDDVLPERDVAGRPLVHEHGISLKHRSHVSLKGIHGFNLARSHKRQPIARD